MKKTLFPLAAFAALTLSAGSAFATCQGDACAPVPSFNVGGVASFEGLGMAVFEGGQGYSVVDKVGGSGIDITLNGSGDFCDVDCNTAGFTFNGYAYEHVQAGAGALSEESGVPSIAQNGGYALGTVQLVIQKMTGSN